MRDTVAVMLIAAAVVRQPYSPTGLIRPRVVGLSHWGSRKSVSFFMRLS